MVNELRNFFVIGLIIGFTPFCYVKETAVDGMFNLQISHIQKFVYRSKHVILSDIVGCSHIKKTSTCEEQRVL
jgi:hypothetical protein